MSKAADLASHGVATVGPVPRTLPQLGLPALGLHEAAALLGTAVSLFVVIVAQSAATARAYAAKHQETLDENADLVGLGAANIAAAFSGTFVVNGSPTKTQIVDDAGGRSQLAQLVTGVVVLVAVLLLTGLLADLPIAALAAVVFLIGAGLVDVAGMRRLLSVRRSEFVVALLTAAAVVVLGVRDGIILAIAASVIDHLRHSYRPMNSVLVKSAAGHWEATPVTPGARTEPGLAVYRFGTSLYYANASRLAADVVALTKEGSPAGPGSTAGPGSPAGPGSRQARGAREVTRTRGARQARGARRAWGARQALEPREVTRTRGSRQGRGSTVTRCGGWFLTAPPSATWTTPRPWCSAR